MARTVNLVAGVTGVEPTIRESKSRALPFGDAPTFNWCAIDDLTQTKKLEILYPIGLSYRYTKIPTGLQPYNPRVATQSLANFSMVSLYFLAKRQVFTIKVCNLLREPHFGYPTMYASRPFWC